MQAALRAARRVEWRVRNDFTGDSQQEYFQGHSGIPDTSNTRLDNAEPKQPQDHLIRILRNESLRNNFIEILQDKRCRDRYLARLPSSWSEFNEGARNVLNDDRLRNAFIKMIQTHRLRDRFIHLLRSLLFREGERTPSLASDDESDDSSSSISTSFGDDVVRPFPHRLDEEEINDERADSPDGGIRPFGP
jgi:hypothetical protein